MEKNTRDRIDELTDEDRALMPVIVEKWIRKGVDVTPVDHAVVEDGMRRCYEMAGLEWHGRVVWAGSPLTTVVSAVMASHILASVPEARTFSAAAIEEAVAGPLKDPLLPPVIGQAVGRPVGGVSMTAEMATRIGKAAAGAPVRSEWSRYIGGQWWAGYAAWRDYYYEIGLKIDKWHRHFAYLDANEAGWWWPHAEFVVVSERPVQLHRNVQNGTAQLHNPDGPAISWSDGRELYFWRGVRIPDWIVNDLNLARINSEANTEIRRCAIEAYGWDRYLEEMGVSAISECPDVANPGQTLSLYALPNEHQVYGTRVRLLVMKNASLDRDGQRRTFAETVPESFPVADGIPLAVCAAAWQFGVSPEIYASLGRAT